MSTLWLFLSLAPVWAQPSSSYNFTALEYFEHQSKEEVRNPKWPERLHFRRASPEESKEAINGSWRYVLSCSGRPLSYEEVKFVSAYNNGVFDTSNTMNYKADGSYESWVFSPKISPGEMRPKLDHAGKFDLREKEGLLVINGEQDLLIIEETGELVMSYIARWADSACRHGEGAQMLAVRLPAM